MKMFLISASSHVAVRYALNFFQRPYCELGCSCVSKLVWLLAADNDYLVNPGSSLRQSIGRPSTTGTLERQVG